jgi:hypothetical protein
LSNGDCRSQDKRRKPQDKDLQAVPHISLPRFLHPECLDSNQLRPPIV